jgi:HK97 family phage prohead protease
LEEILVQSIETREMEFRVTDKDKREVAGIAVPYDTLENGEMFARNSVTLDPEAKLMWQHDQKEPIGKIIEGRHTEAGFEIRAVISETQRGLDAITLLDDNVINRFSVGFVLRDSKTDENRNRIVTDAFVREVSLVSTPWYSDAVVTEVRDENSDPEIPDSASPKEETMENITPEGSDLAEVRESIEMLEREIASITKVEAAAPTYRTAGAFLKAIVDGDENAAKVMERAYEGATTADSVVTPIDFNLIRLVEGANPLGAVFGRGVTPATGMAITFAQVDAITNGTAEQDPEGEDLGYYQLNLETKSVDIKTIGNYSELTRQAIERSTVPYLDSVLRGQAIALGNALAAELRNKYTATVSGAAGAGRVVVRATETYDGWAGALADAAATYFQPQGATIDALVVGKATFKALLALDGTPVISFSNENIGAFGSANPGGLRGTIAGIPIIVDAQLAANGTEDAFVSSLALRQFTSGALRLSQDNAVNLSTAYSLSTYTAVSDDYPTLVVQVVAD